MNRPVTRSVYLVVLDKNLPSPLAPESDEEKDKRARNRRQKPTQDKRRRETGRQEKPDSDDKPAAKKKAKARPTKVDLEGIGQRILALPLPARTTSACSVGKAGALFLAGTAAYCRPPWPRQDPGSRDGRR